GIIYGHEGDNFPHIHETGPYATAAEARRAYEPALAERYGPAVLVSGYEPSDGVDLATGAGQVVGPIGPTTTTLTREQAIEHLGVDLPDTVTSVDVNIGAVDAASRHLTGIGPRLVYYPRTATGILGTGAHPGIV